MRGIATKTVCQILMERLKFAEKTFLMDNGVKTTIKNNSGRHFFAFLPDVVLEKLAIFKKKNSNNIFTTTKLTIRSEQGRTQKNFSRKGSTFPKID